MRDARSEYLIHLVESSDISELEVWLGWGRRIRIVRQRSAAAGVAPATDGAKAAVAMPPQAVAPELEPSPPRADDADLVKVASPMVGTFYRAASPGAPPFVEVGAQVTPGQTLCIIEAMKLMNEIASEVSGSVRRVLVENGQPVEFGQALFLIQPSA